MSEPHIPTSQLPCVQPGGFRLNDDLDYSDVKHRCATWATIVLPSWRFLVGRFLRVRSPGSDWRLVEAGHKSDYRNRPKYTTIAARCHGNKNSTPCAPLRVFSDLPGVSCIITYRQDLSREKSRGYSVYPRSGIMKSAGFDSDSLYDYVATLPTDACAV